MKIDEQQFVEVYDGFAQKIFKYCYFRVSSREEAEDITSQVFMRAWDHIAAGKEVTNMQGFLYRIANNLIIDFYRKGKDRRETSLDNPNNPIDIPDTVNLSGDLEQRMDLNEVHEHLQKLPENYREIIVLKYVNDLSIPEIADVVGISENNVSVRLHRAIDRLKTVMRNGSEL